MARTSEEVHQMVYEFILQLFIVAVLCVLSYLAVVNVPYVSYGVAAVIAGLTFVYIYSCL